MANPDDVTLYKKTGEKGFTKGERSRTSILIRRLIGEALEVRATDIHIEPEKDLVRVRARVDGFLRDLAEYDPEAGARVQGAIKVLCDLDITRKYRMQDGSFSAKVGPESVEFRVSIVEDVHGDKMVIRILETRSEVIDIKKLGLTVSVENQLRHFIRKSQGMMLVSGPTGSGKSTTLYSLLREVDRQRRNVVAIEDPIEYHLQYVTQISVNPKTGVTFASALRSALRQDPNILMVGEVRDAETAGIAIQAGLTGHLVFSTVHARDSVATIYRLFDLGVEPYLVANVLDFTLAQRLVRLLCRQCKQPVDADPKKVRDLGGGLKGKSFGPKGCDKCEGTGYRGRTGIFEMVTITDRIREQILERAPEEQMRQIALEEGLQPVWAAGMEKVNDGLTSVDEIARVLM